MVDSTTLDPSPRPRRPRGVAPALLASQVAATAGWALDSGAHPGAAIVARAEAIDALWRQDEACGEYFALLLAAHSLTVATFVPTDVDSRIRHHAWVDAEPARVASQLDAVDAAQTWDVRLVSARTVADPRAEAPAISGHDGEWLSVYAGALGRALVLEDEALAARGIAAIEASLERQSAVYRAIEAGGDVRELLRAATVLAHNAGDLSRVVEEWPRRPGVEVHRLRYAKLGHERADRFGGAFLRAGMLNKAVTAVENHRFLALRAPKGLRKGHALLMPIGPFFDDWGTLVARSPLLGDDDRPPIVQALIETHLAGPDQWGCLRALVGIHEHAPGGLGRIAPDLPARMRKLVSAGPVRDALKTTREAFERRIVAKAKAALGAAPR